MFAIFYHIFTTINHSIVLRRYKWRTPYQSLGCRDKEFLFDFSHWLIKGSLASNRLGKMTGPIVGNTVGGISEGNLTVPP